MSFLDSLKASVAKDSEARKNVEALLVVLGDKAKGGAKGLGDLLTRLKDSEIADQASSWISTNTNKVVNSDQVQRVLGSDAINKAAKTLNVSAREAGDRVAKALPVVIDNISPTGRLPENLDHIAKELATLMKNPKNRAIAGVAAIGVVGAAAGAVLAARAKSAKDKKPAAKSKAAAKPAAKPKAAAKPAAKPKAAAKPAAAKKPAAKKPAAAKPKAPAKK